MKSYVMTALVLVFMSGTAFAVENVKKEELSCSEMKDCKSCSGKDGQCKEKCTCAKKCECKDCGCNHAKK